MDNFTPYNMHPDAAKSLDNSGLDLVGRLKIMPIPPEQQESFQSKRPIARAINETDIIGEIRHRQVNHVGKTISLSMSASSQFIGLYGEDYTALRIITEKAIKYANMEKIFKRETAEDVIFDWCYKYQQKLHDTSLSQYFISECASKIKDLEIWIPIALLEIEEEFSIGSVKLIIIPAHLFEKMAENYQKRKGQIDANYSAMLASMKQEFLGLTAMAIKIHAEQKKAIETALELAETTCSFLRFFSPAGRIPWAVCPFAPYGSEVLPKNIAFTFEKSFVPSVSRSLSNLQYLPSRLSKKDIDFVLNSGLQDIAHLVEIEKLTKFQQQIRTSVLAYSSGLISHNIHDRLVKCLSALEGIFLRDSSEPIQQNLGERIAFLIQNDPQQRKEITENIKSVYNLRSRYMHHNIAIKDEENIEIFFNNAWNAMRYVFKYGNRYTNKLDFITAIENKKFGLSY